MITPRIPTIRNQALISLSMFAISLWLAWEVAGKIVTNDLRSLEFAAIGFAACAVALIILRSWRTGFYLFFVWMMFEDLIRKYMGNGTLLFFGKDVLLGLIYISLFVAVRRGQEKSFRPHFLFLFSLFFWLGVLQIFNLNSPSIFYGLLGFKLYFYYVPLVFAGYALVRNDEDLRTFLNVNALIAGLIALLGIIQAIAGNSFLNPARMDPALADLGNLYKVTPISNQLFSLPDSVFVSAGRFGEYLILAFVVVMGATGYSLLRAGSGRKLGFLVIAVLGAASLLSGSRGVVLYVLLSAIALSVGFLWGAPWRQGEAHRMVKAIRRSLIVAGLGLAILVVAFPEQAGSRIAFYAETLLPTSSAYEVTNRTWYYPVQNLIGVFSEPHWVMGEGIGTASLGTQYVARLTGVPMPNIWVEEGYGVLIAEMGIIAPFLWLLWTGALMYYSWRAVRRLRETRYFPIALAIFWYAFLLLFPITYGGLSAYQNYVCNAYMWLMVGILFRLPEIAMSQPVTAVTPQPPHSIRQSLG